MEAGILIKWNLSWLLPSILCLAFWNAATFANTTRYAFRVQLGAFAIAENAPAVWRHLRAAQPDLLGDLQIRVQRLDSGVRVLHLLQAGPLANIEVARALCAALTARGIDFLVVNP